MADLVGPVEGVVVLPERLAWTGRREYDLGDPADAAVLYERVIVEAVDVADLVILVNAGRLRQLWGRLFLPLQVRRLWEGRFPELVAAA